MKEAFERANLRNKQVKVLLADGSNEKVATSSAEDDSSSDEERKS